MNACHTLLILGMGFLKSTGCRPDAAQGYLEFTGKDGSKFVVVDTVDGDGMLKEHGMLPEGAVPEDPEALIIPVLLKQNTWNPKIQDVNKLNEAMGFSLGETTMLPLKIAKDAASWAHNRALQPDAAALWGRGLYVMMPMVLHSGKIFDNAPHSIAILNTAKEVIAKERSTRLGKLYNASSIIPDVVELLDSFDDVMEHLMFIYTVVSFRSSSRGSFLIHSSCLHTGALCCKHPYR